MYRRKPSNGVWRQEHSESFLVSWASWNSWIPVQWQTLCQDNKTVSDKGRWLMVCSHYACSCRVVSSCTFMCTQHICPYRAHMCTTCACMQKKWPQRNVENSLWEDIRLCIHVVTFPKGKMTRSMNSIMVWTNYELLERLTLKILSVTHFVFPLDVHWSEAFNKWQGIGPLLSLESSWLLDSSRSGQETDCVVDWMIAPGTCRCHPSWK